jgi:hypothetical protein
MTLVGLSEERRIEFDCVRVRIDTITVHKLLVGRRN